LSGNKPVEQVTKAYTSTNPDQSAQDIYSIWSDRVISKKQELLDDYRGYIKTYCPNEHSEQYPEDRPYWTRAISSNGAKPNRDKND
jgi:hypothetical protein